MRSAGENMKNDQCECEEHWERVCRRIPEMHRT